MCGTGEQAGVSSNIPPHRVGALFSVVATPLAIFLLVLWQAMRDRGTEPPEELSFPPDDVMQKEHTRSIDYHLKWGHGPWLGRALLPGQRWHVRS
jgi:hypothetical protein